MTLPHGYSIFTCPTNPDNRERRILLYFLARDMNDAREIATRLRLDPNRVGQLLSRMQPTPEGPIEEEFGPCHDDGEWYTWFRR